MTSIFGNIVSTDQLEEAVSETINLWFKTYAREYELQHALAQDALPVPVSYLVSEKLDRDNADQLPTVVIVSPGLARPPRQEGDGTYRATFGVAVGVFVAAGTREDTTTLTRQYAAIIRAIMIQKQALGGFADGTTWIGENYDDDFAFTDQQTISAGQVLFEVDVVGVVARFGGPAEPTAPDPDNQPGSEWPTADTVTPIVTTKG